MNPADSDRLERFSLVAGGPFLRVLDRRGLIVANRSPTPPAAI